MKQFISAQNFVLNFFHEIVADVISLQDIDIVHRIPSRAGKETKPIVFNFLRRLAKHL